jgi:cysteine desulfurase
MYLIEKYFDYAATCPMAKPILDKLYKNYWGNSSSLHSWGHKAKVELEKAREDMMKILNINPDIGRIYFTSGGSESDNIALSGTQLLKHQYKLTSQIEHDAIHRNLNSDILPHIPANRNGIVDLNYIRNKINEDKENKIGLISVMAINNETGVIQPIEEIYDLCKEKNIIFHTDAVQAIGKIDIDFNKVDILSGSAHKFYGPKGIGFIYIKNKIFDQIKPVIYGGGHEYGISSGTVNVPGIMAMRDALLYTIDKNKKNNDKYKKFKEIVLNTLEGYIQVNGDLKNSIPHILNI